MADVLRASVELPTIIFTAILAIAAVMWILSLVGALDLGGDAAAGVLGNALERALELRAALAALGPEDVPSQTARVHTNQRLGSRLKVPVLQHAVNGHR